MRDSEQGFNTYREGITEDKEDDSNEEESSILNESSLIKEGLREDSEDNGTDKKDVSKKQDVNEEFTTIKVESKLTRFTRNRKKLMTSIINMSFSTNAITLKVVHSNPFRGETTKTRIFILQVDNKIVNVVRTFERRKIRYVILLLREVTTKWTTTYIDQYGKTIFNTY